MEKKDIKLRMFAFFSANLHQLLPDLPFEQHRALFQEAAGYSRLALDEARHQHWLAADVLPVAGLPDPAAPGIIATFHTGPYRLLPMWLDRMGLPLTLLLSEEVGAAGIFHASCDCLRAEDPLVLRQLMRALDRGRFVVIYVDGQLGTGSHAASRLNHREPPVIEFLGRPLQIRAGVAELARLSGAPVYPMWMGYDAQLQPSLTQGESCQILPGTRDRQAVMDLMQGLYGQLSTFVRQHPMQWEGWYHLHHDLLGARGTAVGGLLRHYSPFRLGERYFLLHKESLSAYPIAGEVYTKMSQLIDL